MCRPCKPSWPLQARLAPTSTLLLHKCTSVLMGYSHLLLSSPILLTRSSSCHGAAAFASYLGNGAPRRQEGAHGRMAGHFFQSITDLAVVAGLFFFNQQPTLLLCLAIVRPTGLSSLSALPINRPVTSPQCCVFKQAPPGSFDPTLSLLHQPATVLQYCSVYVPGQCRWR